MDLFEDEPRPGSNAPEFTVSELSGAVKRSIEGQFSRVRVRGEIGRVNRHRSGHVYFDLKDDRSVLASVSWKGQVPRLGLMPEEGIEVIATGRLTTFGAQSKYQMVVDGLEPAGQGALMAMLEKRRKALEAEGLFAAARKKPLPFLPEVIGVITSPQGAVIRDILHRLADRFPRKVLIWPVAVQGPGCAPQVAAAIRGFNALGDGSRLPRPDLLIVARGGGSVEDLWGFNEEAVVRAAAESAIPLISAVGHETDTTLIDHAADRRAPTPTAAAEMAVPVRLELLAALDGLGGRLTRATATAMTRRGDRLRDRAARLPRPERLSEPGRQRLDIAADRLPRALTGTVAARRGRWREMERALRPGRLELDLRAGADRLAALSHRLDTGLVRAADRAGDGMERLSGRLPAALDRMLERRRMTLGAQAARLSIGPVRREALRQATARDRAAARLGTAMTARLAEMRRRLDGLDRLRESFDHGRILARGFALVRGPDGALVTRQEAAVRLPRLSLAFADGTLDVVPGTTPKRRARKKPVQGSLFDDPGQDPK